MCGIESAGFEGDAAKMEKAIRKDLMLHAYMFLQRGLPMIYSGDEIGQVNDYSYKEDPRKREDSGISTGERSAGICGAEEEERDCGGPDLPGAPPDGRELRKKEAILGPDAQVCTWDTGDDGVLGLMRKYEGKTLVGIFNFTDWEKEYISRSRESTRICLRKRSWRRTG